MTNEQMLLLCCKAYENKLRELMKPEDYNLFTKAVSIEVCRADVMTWNDGDFKQFTLEHIDELFADDFDAKSSIRSILTGLIKHRGMLGGAPEEGDELEEV